MQATHDLLYHGPTQLARFDHFEFPGVVPRTFIGPILLATVSAPAVLIFRLFGVSKFYSLLVIRGALAVLVWLPVRAIGRSLTEKYGANTGECCTAPDSQLTWVGQGGAWSVCSAPSSI